MKRRKRARTLSTDFELFGKIGQVRLTLAAKNTCWWSNTKKRWRSDELLGIMRSYHRPSGIYVYKLVMGRVVLGYSYGRARASWRPE